MEVWRLLKDIVRHLGLGMLWCGAVRACQEGMKRAANTLLSLQHVCVPVTALGGLYAFFSFNSEIGIILHNLQRRKWRLRGSKRLLKAT